MRSEVEQLAESVYESSNAPSSGCNGPIPALMAALCEACSPGKPDATPCNNPSSRSSKVTSLSEPRSKSASEAYPPTHLVYNITMPADPKIGAFIDEALAIGMPHASMVGMLTARGWPEKDIYEALAAHYKRTTGIDVPGRAASGASAKEAFFYLLIFSTLATWTIGFGALFRPDRPMVRRPAFQQL